MKDEFDALMRNRTWRLVPRPPGARVLTGKWVLKNKLNPDGTLERRKARWVVRGDHQRPGVDFDQTFSPVVKLATIRTVLTLATPNKWPVHQLDVSNAFLHGVLRASIIFCGNVSAVYLSDNPVHHKRTKHVELDIHFVRERTALGQLRVLHVPSQHQFTDIMTKGLPTSLFQEFRDSLCIRSADALTEGGVSDMLRLCIRCNLVADRFLWVDRIC